MNDLDKTTRRLSSFGSVDEVMEWLHHHHCYSRRGPIQQAWGARTYRLARPDKYKHTVDYIFRITGKHRHNHYVTIERVMREKEE